MDIIRNAARAVRSRLNSSGSEARAAQTAEIDPSKLQHDRILAGTMIGRRTPNIDPPYIDGTVSRKHAQLLPGGRLRDLHSKRGTFVNGHELKPNVFMRLRPGDIVRFGLTKWHFRFDNDTLHLPTLTLGRLHSDYPITDTTVSGNHCKLTSDGVLTDIGSKNGTYIDGSQERITEPVQLRNGTIVRLGDSHVTHFYYDQGRLQPLSPEKARLLLRLFPNGLGKSEFRQMGRGDCTFLSTLKGVLYHNPVHVINMLEPTAGDKVRVTFYDRPTEPVILSENEATHNGVIGDPGVQMLETAFGRYLYRSDPTKQPLTIAALDEGGYADKAVRAFTTGKTPQMIYNNGAALRADKTSSEAARALLARIESNPAKYIAAASTKGQPEHAELIGNHAYAILDANLSNSSLIKLANPHNTSEPIVITLNEFLRNFRRLTAASSD